MYLLNDKSHEKILESYENIYNILKFGARLPPFLSHTNQLECTYMLIGCAYIGCLIGCAYIGCEHATSAKSDKYMQNSFPKISMANLTKT